ncbi:MAG: PLDc N-terminal domain-containing protein [Candidatus Paceibacterota bacterium]
MKKLMSMLAILFIPIISFAQNYRMENFSGYRQSGMGGIIFTFFLVLLIPIVWIAFCIFVFVFWLMMLVDAIKNAPKDMRLVWVVVIIFTNIVGALVYYFMEKKKNICKTETKKESTETKE